MTAVIIGTAFVCLLLVIAWKVVDKLTAAKYQWTKQTLLITGGSQGIGKCIVEQAVARGCKKIVILDIIEPTFKLTSAMEFIKCDISNKAAIRQVKDKLDQMSITPSILINNAGIWNRGKRICELRDEEIERVMNVNTMGPIWLIREFLPAMLKAKHGRIINVSSVLGVGGVGQMTDYCASKFAVFGMNEALRMELKTDGFSDVKTCVVCPFHVATQLFKDKVQWNHQWLMRTLQPAEVAAAIIWGIECGKSEILLPPIASIIPFFRILPTFLYDGIHHMLGSDNSIIRSH